MVPHVQLSTVILADSEKMDIFFLITNSKFFSGLTTAKAVDPLPKYIEISLLKIAIKMHDINSA
jgi:hypothetical protein